MTLINPTTISTPLNSLESFHMLCIDDIYLLDDNVTNAMNLLSYVRHKTSKNKVDNQKLLFN